jgi:hypothetical protein
MTADSWSRATENKLGSFERHNIFGRFIHIATMVSLKQIFALAACGAAALAQSSADVKVH